MLNAFYEETYPNLRYITFVNGRSRAEIVPELEVHLSLSLSLSLPFLPTICYMNRPLFLDREFSDYLFHHHHKMQER